MEKKTAKRLIAMVLALVLLTALAACGGQGAGEKKDDDTLKGIYEALVAPDSAYSRNKAMMLEYYPELGYTETLGADRITLGFQANGNEYFTDGSWDFVRDGERLSATFSNEDYTGLVNMLYVAEAAGASFGMERELVTPYLNGLSMLGLESENFVMTEDETAGTTTCSISIAGPWDMKELDRMVLDEAVLDAEELDESYTSQAGSLGKLLYMANGSADHYTVLIGEYGALDEIAYRSVVNLVTLRKPAGFEAFLADFTELKDLESDGYAVVLDPDDDTVAEMMGERSEKYRYVLVRFGDEEYGEEEYLTYVPDAEDFANGYFRVVAALPKGTAGASLAEAQAACEVLGFALGNEIWLADVPTLRANMLEAWESLTDDERTAFDENFPSLNELLYSCYADWDAVRGRFDDAGVAEAMEERMEDGTAEWSWDTLSAHTWTLGNSDESTEK